MNYQRHYDLLIQRAQQRQKPDGYTEKHHILPRCLGGGDEPENIAILTAREHYVAHQLLVKIHPTEFKLTVAAVLISQVGKHNSHMYAWLRNRIVAGLKGKPTPMNAVACVAKREATKLAKSDEEKRIVGKRISDGIKKHLEGVPGGFYSENIKRAVAALTPEQLSVNGRKARMMRTPEQRSADGKHAVSHVSITELRDRAQRMRDGVTTAQRQDSARLQWSKRTPEQRSEIARKAYATRRENNARRAV